MKGNFIAKHMNTINRNSVHTSLKDYSRDYRESLEEGLKEHQESLEEKQHKSEGGIVDE